MSGLQIRLFDTYHIVHYRYRMRADDQALANVGIYENNCMSLSRYYK